MAQYFENVNLPSNIEEFSTLFNGKEFRFKTDNGVFSKEKLDFGTRVLLENLPLKDMHGDILDLGCGYGVVSIILSSYVDFADVFPRSSFDIFLKNEGLFIKDN